MMNVPKISAAVDQDALITSDVIELLRGSGQTSDVYVIDGKRYRRLAYVTGLNNNDERYRNPGNYDMAVTLLSAIAKAGASGLVDEGLLIRTLEREGFIDLVRLPSICPAALRLGFKNEIDKLARWTAQEGAKKIDSSIEAVGRTSIDPNFEIWRRVTIRGAACSSCADISDGELKKWREDLSAQLEAERPKRFKEAEDFLKMLGGGAAPFASWRSVSDDLKRVQGLEEWTALQPALAELESNEYTRLETIGNAVRAFWLKDFAKWFKGYINKPLLSGLPGELGKMGRWYETASVLANESFTEEKLRIPDDISALPDHVRRTGGNIMAVYKAAEGAEFTNKAGLFTLGVGAAVAGIWLGGLLSSCVLAGEIGGGVAVTELSLSARLMLEARLLFVNTAGFTAGSELVFVPIAGLPKSKQFLRSFGANLLVFGGLGVIGRGLSWASGFSKSGEVMKAIEAGGEIPASGRALNGLHAAMGYESGLGLLHKALQFGLVFAFLEVSNVPLSWTGLVSKGELRSKDNSLFGLLSRAAQLGVIILFAGRLRPGEGILTKAQEKAALQEAAMRFDAMLAGEAFMLRDMKERWHFSAYAEGGNFDPLSRLRELGARMRAVANLSGEGLEALAPPARDRATIKQLAEFAETGNEAIFGAVPEWRQRMEVQSRQAARLADIVEDMHNICASGMGRLEQDGRFVVVPSSLRDFADVQRSFNDAYGSGILLLPVTGDSGRMFRFEVVNGAGEWKPFLHDPVFTPYPEIKRKGGAKKDVKALL